MVDLIKGYQLFEWADVAKELIRKRIFAVSEVQAEACKNIKFWNQELNHLQEMRLLAPSYEPTCPIDIRNQNFELHIMIFKPPQICLKNNFHD